MEQGMETLLVRLKRYDPRRGHVLRRFSYAGVTVHEERGWYRVAKEIGEYLRTARQVPGDNYSPLAFDVCTDEEAKAIDAKDEAETKVRRLATDEIKLTAARVESSDLAPSSPKQGGKKDRS